MLTPREIMSCLYYLGITLVVTFGETGTVANRIAILKKEFDR